MGKTKKVKGTKQTLEFTEEPKKFRVKAIKCKNERQKALIREIEQKPITFVSGFAGTGKTFVSLYAALQALVKGQFEKLVLVKSV